MDRQVIVIGLDGATLDLIRPRAQEAKLPNLARLVHEGVSGELRSAIPPCTAPAWTVFMTGKSAGKLGIHAPASRACTPLSRIIWRRHHSPRKSWWKYGFSYRRTSSGSSSAPRTAAGAVSMTTSGRPGGAVDAAACSRVMLAGISSGINAKAASPLPV